MHHDSEGSCRNEDSGDSNEGASEVITTLSPELRWELLCEMWTQTKKMSVVITILSPELRWKPLGVGESSDESGANKESVEVWGMRGLAIHRPGWKAGCAGARWIQMSGLVRCTTARSECATCRSIEGQLSPLPAENPVPTGFVETTGRREVGKVAVTVLGSGRGDRGGTMERGDRHGGGGKTMS